VQNLSLNRNLCDEQRYLPFKAPISVAKPQEINWFLEEYKGHQEERKDRQLKFYKFLAILTL
jgi:hypothetical protein